MIYLTQLIFIQTGKATIFHEFEDFAIPLMEKYGGEIYYRLRPTAENYVTAKGELPYEIHFLSFPSEQLFSAFIKDETRLSFMHLKEASVKSVILVKGEKL